MLSAATQLAVGDACAALASLDSLARRLPNPELLRRPALRREAQSTSALDGTYAALDDVLAADEDAEQSDANLREVLNYVRAAEHAFACLREGRPLTVGLLADLQGRLVAGTAHENRLSGRVRDVQVVIGSNPQAPVHAARVVPPPPGPELEASLRDLIDWMQADHAGRIDPIVAAALAHYQFETLHPFHDGNGRIGRLLIVAQLLASTTLTEPTLTVSPWFEARRAEYYDGLQGVSARGDWDSWVRLFTNGVAASARETEQQLLDLLAVQAVLIDRVRRSPLRADSALRLVDLALERPVFTVQQVKQRLAVTYPRANALVGQLVELDVLRQYGAEVYARRFAAPDVLAVLLR